MTNLGPVPFVPWGTSRKVRRSKNIHNEKASTFHETLEVGVKDAGKATALRMGKCAISVRALIISKPFVILRLQPGRARALTEARSHSRTDTVPWGATVAKAKEVATVNIRRRRPQRSRQSRKHMQ